MKFLFISALFILFAGCGKKDESKRRETPIEQVRIEEIMNKQDFECASLGDKCPGGMARLLIINSSDEERSGVCTGFMVSETQLVTNHHCVSTAEDCSNTYIAIYDGSEYAKARCLRIIKSDQDVEDPNDPTRKIDFTVMEINRAYEGEFFKLSASNASANDEIHTWVIDHTGLDKIPANLFESRVTEFECQVADQNERASLMMRKCPIISGNSGSPSLNTQGEVVGVIWGGNATIVDSSLSLSLRRQLDAVGLATEVNHFRNYVEPL